MGIFDFDNVMQDVAQNRLSAGLDLGEELKQYGDQLEEQKKVQELMITSAQSFEGYTIINYCGLVFGETIFKQSLLDSIGAGLDDFVNKMSLSARELSGSVSLIEKAREYALTKIKYEAVRKGANAIIAVATNNSIGADITYLQIYGTAVKVIKSAGSIEDSVSSRRRRG